MTELIISILPFLVLAYVVLLALKRIKRFFTPYKDTPFGFKGKLVYLDKGKNSATFFNKKYRIAAKGGDFIYLTDDGAYVLIEYKSRKGRIHQSDIAQTIASVLAARSIYPITRAIIATETQSKEINVLGSDDVLYNNIKEVHLLTQQIKNGMRVNTYYNAPYKCQSCNMRTYCTRKSVD
ncbi:MAG: hypothetical protein P8I03_11770 [Thalassotalea sp.]|nr:hypothetical protein [Thalassotalea sp.]